jgi:hypothetical protein
VTWFGWFVVGYWGVNGVASVLLVGKRREPISAEAAALSILMYVALIVGVLAAGTGRL